jgi:hypothetical protein
MDSRRGELVLPAALAAGRFAVALAGRVELRRTVLVAVLAVVVPLAVGRRSVVLGLAVLTAAVVRAVAVVAVVVPGRTPTSGGLPAVSLLEPRTVSPYVRE